MSSRVLVWGRPAMVAQIFTAMLDTLECTKVAAPDVANTTLAQAIENEMPDVVISALQDDRTNVVLRGFLDARAGRTVITVTEDWRWLHLVDSTGPSRRPLQPSREALVREVLKAVGAPATARPPDA